MAYSRSEIHELGLGRLTEGQLDRAVIAFNGFDSLFGGQWVEAYFKNSRSHRLVLLVISLWEDWSTISGLPGADALRKRWADGPNKQGVESEIRVATNLARNGSVVELEPSVGVRPDNRFNAGGNWVYSEVAKRGITKLKRRAEMILDRAAVAAGEAVPGMHGKVAILRGLTNEELERVIAWLRSITGPGEATLEDLAFFQTDDLACPSSFEDQFAQLVPEPRLLSVYLGSKDGTVSGKGTACLCVSDQAAQQFLEEEATQLPSGPPGIVWIDLSRVVGGIDEWTPLIRRSFESTRNTGIAAVVLFKSVLDDGGPVTRWSILVNPHAGSPLRNAEIQVLERFARRY